MPNWVCGTLRVRGKTNDLKKFVLEGLVPVDFYGNTNAELAFDEYGYVSCNGVCHINGTHRGFVDDLDVYLDFEEYETTVICLNARFAWGVDANQLAEISKNFEIDFRFYGFEAGNCFNQDIEILHGEIKKDEAIEFDDYDWECICPLLGG